MKVRFEPERVGREMREAPLVSARPPIDMLIGEVIGAVAARVPELKKICRYVGSKLRSPDRDSE